MRIAGLAAVADTLSLGIEIQSVGIAVLAVPGPVRSISWRKLDVKGSSSFIYLSGTIDQVCLMMGFVAVIVCSSLIGRRHPLGPTTLTASLQFFFAQLITLIITPFTGQKDEFWGQNLSFGSLQSLN